MLKNQITKDLKNHKFPHLQNEVDSLLESFDDIAYGVENMFSSKQGEFNHINIDDMINGRFEQRALRPRVSVVEKARLQEQKIKNLINNPHSTNSDKQNNILIARRETKSILEEFHLLSLPTKNEIKKNTVIKKAIKFAKLILKYLKF